VAGGRGAFAGRTGDFGVEAAGGERRGGDRTNKAIAAAGEGFDIGGGAGSSGEGFADDGDVLGEIGLIDDAVGPNGGHNLIFGKYGSGILDKDEEGLDSFAGEVDGKLVAKNDLSDGVECKLAQLVDWMFLQQLISRF
jgi:hypothetical protein